MCILVLMSRLAHIVHLDDLPPALLAAAIALLAYFAAAVIKQMVEEEYDDIARALAEAMFEIVSVVCWATGLYDSRRDAVTDMADHWELATEEGQGRLTTAIGLAIGESLDAAGHLGYTLGMATTKAYAVCGCRFLVIYRADPLQKWVLLRFVASQRRRLRGHARTTK